MNTTYFRFWQADQQASVDEPSDSIDRAINYLEGVGHAYTENKELPVIGYEGRLFQCWLFFQFVMGGVGAYTPPGTLFIRGWRSVSHVLSVAEKLGLQEVCEKLREVNQRLDEVPLAERENYDRLDGMTRCGSHDPSVVRLRTILESAPREFFKQFKSSDHIDEKLTDTLVDYVQKIYEEHPDIIAELGPADQVVIPYTDTSAKG